MIDSNDIDDLELLPVDTEEGEIDSYTQEQIDAIRKKTFTNELRGLFDKVTMTPEEKKAGAKPEKMELTDVIDLDLPRDAVIRSLHDLFYKTVNLEKADSISVGFNPFSIVNQDLFHYSVDLLKRECAKIGITQYAVLCFDPMKKSYFPTVAEITSIDKNNLVISPEELLYSDIFRAANGVIVDEKAMSRYRYLEKRFSKDFPFSGFAYAILVQNIVMDLWTENDAAVHKELYPGNLYPIFIALIKSDTVDPDSLCPLLKKNLSFVLYIINNHVGSRPIPAEHRTPAFTYSLIDTYGRMYSRIEGAICLFLSFRGSFDNVSYITMTYINSRICSMIGPNSTVLHFEKNKIILFLTRDDHERIEKQLSETISGFGDQISLQNIERYSHLDLFQLMTAE